MDTDVELDVNSLNLRFSYDEYIDSPLTLQQLGLFEAQRQLCRAYERDLIQSRLAAGGFTGIAGIILTELSGAPPALAIAIGASLTVLLAILTVFQSGREAMHKHPMVLWVGDQNWIRGTSGHEFEQVSIRPYRLADSTSALTLFRNIQAQGRGACEFERYLLRRLVIDDRKQKNTGRGTVDGGI